MHCWLTLCKTLNYNIQVICLSAPACLDREGQSVCLSVSRSVCLSVRPSVCPHVICSFVMLSSNSLSLYSFFHFYSPGPREIPGCRGRCQFSYCKACYVGDEPIFPPPGNCTLCNLSDYTSNTKCYRKWARCTRRAHRRRFGKVYIPGHKGFKRHNPLVKCFNAGRLTLIVLPQINLCPADAHPHYSSYKLAHSYFNEVYDRYNLLLQPDFTSDKEFRCYRPSCPLRG